MKKFLTFSLLSLHCIYGNQPLTDYFSHIKQSAQSRGNHHAGEIEIVVDPLQISRIIKIQQERLLKKGFSQEDAAQFSRVGIVSEDPYWIWIRDAVYFPKGVSGTYDRLISHSSGVAVLPVLPSGEIVLNLNYRHATRSWELEIPRGGTLPEETFEEAALRELKEETGCIASSLTFLGEMAPDTGVLSSVTPLFLAQISERQESTPESSEAIAAPLSFTKEELRQGLINGFLELSVLGEKKQVPLRDPFLTFALLQAELRKLLSKVYCPPKKC